MSRIIRIPPRLISANLQIRLDAAPLVPLSAPLHPYFIEISGAAAGAGAQLRVIYHC